MLKDAQTNLKGNFEIIGKRDPELWDRGYFICYKDETDMYVEPILVATNGTNFSYKHEKRVKCTKILITHQFLQGRYYLAI